MIDELIDVWSWIFIIDLLLLMRKVNGQLWRLILAIIKNLYILKFNTEVHLCQKSLISVQNSLLE